MDNRPRNRNKIYWDVEEILAKRIDEHRGVEYLIHWNGFPIDQASWQPVKNLDRCKDKLAEFEAEQMRKIDHQGTQILFLENFIQHHMSQISAFADATVDALIDVVNASGEEGEEHNEGDQAELAEDEIGKQIIMINSIFDIFSSFFY